MSADRRQAVGRAAFTLIEVILTMGLLVMLAAILWPIAGGWREAGKLDRSADHLRAMLEGARLRAIEDGVPVRFALQPNSNVYRVEIAGQPMAAPVEPQTDPQQRPEEFDEASFVGLHELEEGLQFVVVQQGDASQGNAGEYAIIYQPDGTTTDAEFMVIDSQNIGRVFTIRGLTGVVSVGKPTNMDAATGSGLANTTASPRSTR